MKRIFDIKCTTKSCAEYELIEEVWCNHSDLPDCPCCGNARVVALTKPPSAHLKGGEGAGFYNDGYIVVAGSSKNVRRKK